MQSLTQRVVRSSYLSSLWYEQMLHNQKQVVRCNLTPTFKSSNYFNLLPQSALFPIQSLLALTLLPHQHTSDSSDGSGSKIFDPGQVNFLWLGSGLPFMVWVWIWKISSKNINFFNFLPFGSKKISLGRVRKYPGRPLIYCGSKLSSGRAGSGPISKGLDQNFLIPA